MIRHTTIKPETAEPSIGQVEMHLLAETALRTDGEAKADDQHPDHQFRIDRRPAGVGIVRLQRCAEIVEVQKPIDPPQQMIFGNVVIQTKNRKTTGPAPPALPSSFHSPVQH